MTDNILYFHKRDLTESDRKVIKLARRANVHDTTSALIALWKAKEILKLIAEEERRAND